MEEKEEKFGSVEEEFGLVKEEFIEEGESGFVEKEEEEFVEEEEEEFTEGNSDSRKRRNSNSVTLCRRGIRIPSRCVEEDLEFAGEGFEFRHAV